MVFPYLASYTNYRTVQYVHTHRHHWPTSAVLTTSLWWKSPPRPTPTTVWAATPASPTRPPSTDLTPWSGPTIPIFPTHTVQIWLTFLGKLRYTMGIPTVSSATSAARRSLAPPPAGSGTTPPWTPGAIPPRSGFRGPPPPPRPLTA